MSNLEGFGLPPVEAMSCGCLIVGFHGQGGLEYATPENGLWCAEGDPMNVVDAITSAVEKLRTGDPAINNMIQSGRRTAAAYTSQRQANELIAVIRKLI